MSLALVQIRWKSGIWIQMILMRNIYSYNIRVARLVLSAPPLSLSSLPLLQQLHWLPIEARVSYKLCCLMYRVVHGAAPSYLTELCEPCFDTRAFDLLLAVISSFHVPIATLRTVHSLLLHPLLGTSYTANIHNCSTLATFLTKLKAHLFTVSFSHYMFITLYVGASELWLLGAIVSSGDWLIDWLIDSNRIRT